MARGAEPFMNLIRIMPAEGWMSGSSAAQPPPIMAEPVLARIRDTAPRVHAIVNRVATALVANALLAVGALPAMTHSEAEVEAFVSGSASLLINLGTPDEDVIAGLRLATSRAHAEAIPWALDPVGVAASAYRLALARDLLTLKPAVIRGNAVEVMALGLDRPLRGAGIDACAHAIGDDPAAVFEAGAALARRTGAVVAITGADDTVITPDGAQMTVPGGHPMSRLVAGAGCVTTALVAAGLAVAPAQRAAVAGLAAMKAAAALAAGSASGPGSFATGLLDALHQLSGPMTKPPLDTRP